jgi:ketosteroid isomerase-like protein
MLRSMIGLGLAAAVATAAGAWGAPAEVASSDEAQLVALEQSWMAAMQRRDQPALDSLVAAEFQLSGVGALDQPPVPRSVWIDNSLHHLNVGDVRFEKTRVHVFGDAAVVESVFTWKGDFDGEAFTDTVPLIDTWMKRDGRWQVVYRLVGEPPAKP